MDPFFQTLHEPTKAAGWGGSPLDRHHYAGDISAGRTLDEHIPTAGRTLGDNIPIAGRTLGDAIPAGRTLDDNIPIAGRTLNEADSFLRESLAQNTRYREVLSERMTLCEGQGRALRDMVWDKFSFLEKEYAEMKVNLLEKISQIASENRLGNKQGIDELKQRLDQTEAQVTLLPQIEVDQAALRQAVTAAEERVIDMSRDLESMKLEIRASLDRVVLMKSDLTSATADMRAQTEALRAEGKQVVEVAWELGQRIKTAEKNCDDANKCRMEEIKKAMDELSAKGEKMARMDQTIDTHEDGLHHAERELEKLRKDMADICTQSLNASRCLLQLKDEMSTIEGRHKDEQQSLLNRLIKAEMTQACDKAEVEKHVAELRAAGARAGKACQGDREAVAARQKNVDASIRDIRHAVKSLGSEIGSVDKKAEATKGSVIAIQADLPLHQEIRESFKRETLLEREATGQWTERVVQLQELVTQLQAQHSPAKVQEEQCVLAGQITLLQAALQSQGVHTEDRLRRIETMLQTQRLHTGVDNALQDVNIGTA